VLPFIDEITYRGQLLDETFADSLEHFVNSLTLACTDFHRLGFIAQGELSQHLISDYFIFVSRAIDILNEVVLVADHKF